MTFSNRDPSHEADGSSEVCSAYRTSNGRDSRKLVTTPGNITAGLYKWRNSIKRTKHQQNGRSHRELTVTIEICKYINIISVEQ